MSDVNTFTHLIGQNFIFQFKKVNKKKSIKVKADYDKLQTS